MFIVAGLHYFVFSHKPYVDAAAPHTSLYTSFMSMWDVSDVRHDVVEHMKGVGKFNILGKRKRNPMEINLLAEETELTGTETSGLLPNSDEETTAQRNDTKETESAVVIEQCPMDKENDVHHGPPE